MRRAIPFLAVLCSGVALGALAVAMIGVSRPNPVLEEVVPLDPVAAAPEIAQLRESRGSVLAGTSLAAADDALEFTAALANQSGAAISPNKPETLVEQLRRNAQEYEHQAQRLEEKADYGKADDLRRLADDARQLARSLNAPPELLFGSQNR